MNDKIKTLVFSLVAFVCISLAYFTTPSKRDPSSGPDRMGQQLFEEFNPLAATGIEIVEIDEENLEPKSIEVAQTEKGWFIRRPGKPDYPANADNQVKDVSTLLFDLRILDQASEGAGEHANFGVLDPSKAQPGDPGIGRMISLKNNTGSNLAQLIIGNEAEGLSNTRYVRKPDENSVYRVEVQNVGDVTTKFVDWVEKDFLDLDKWNIKRVTFDNYEIKNGTLTPSIKHVLDYDSSEWKLMGGSLANDEELDKDILDGMKDAFDDLEIIDVESKPEVLASSLRKGSEFVDANNVQQIQSAANSLITKGFQPINVTDESGKPKAYPNGKPILKVVSQKGEVLVGMKDGVEYVLRFGEIYRGPEEEENATGDSRYIYAFARVNQSLIDSPGLEPVPGSLGSEQKQGENGPTGEEGVEATPPPAPTGPPPNFVPPSPPPSISPPPPPPPITQVNEKQAAVNNEDNSSIGDAEFAKKKAERDAEIARIQGENARKQKEFDDKVATAQNRVNELNENLGGWYYVISNEVFEKINLQRKDFVKKKEAEESENPTEVKASHILISYKGADRADSKVVRTKEEAKAEAERIRKSIVEEGMDFAELAQKHSDGPSKSKGGDLGKFKFEVMAKPFSEAAFALSVGMVSEVVETGFGFHVIKRTE